MSSIRINRCTIAVLVGSFIAFNMACDFSSKSPRNVQIANGKAIFVDNCVSCHGMGDQPPTITDLDPPAKDLTKIMERRPYAEEFPIMEIVKFIDGRQHVKAQGPRDMPAWGDVFSQQGLTEAEIKVKEQDLLAYLIAIQK